MRIRQARPDERPAVMNVLDGAMLAVDDMREKIRAGTVLVAVEADRILGVLAYSPTSGGTHVDAIAVRRARRDSGIGRALVRAVVDEFDRVTAEFDADARPFYESLGFEIESLDDERFRGILARDDRL